MCLYVKKSHVKKPLQGVECFKLLRWDGRGWVTPYQYAPVIREHGHFVPRNPSKRRTEYQWEDTIDGGYLHAHVVLPWGRNVIGQDAYINGTRKDNLVYFSAIAYDVQAIGLYNDLVCKKLYIPAFDKRRKKECIW